MPKRKFSGENRVFSLSGKVPEPSKTFLGRSGNVFEPEKHFQDALEHLPDALEHFQSTLESF